MTLGIGAPERFPADPEPQTCSVQANAPDSQPMRRLRIMLTLLLCLTVPVAGWASLLVGPVCPLPHKHATVGPRVAGHATVASAKVHDHQSQCGTLAPRGKPCKGDRCGCGCGIGACTASMLTVLTPLPMLHLSHARDSAVAFSESIPSGFPHGTLPLRPPIC